MCAIRQKEERERVQDVNISKININSLYIHTHTLIHKYFTFYISLKLPDLLQSLNISKTEINGNNLN